MRIGTEPEDFLAVNQNINVKDSLGIIVSLCSPLFTRWWFVICGEEHLERLLVFIKASGRLSFNRHLENCSLHKNKFTLKVKKD